MKLKLFNQLIDFLHAERIFLVCRVLHKKLTCMPEALHGEHGIKMSVFEAPGR